MQIKYGFGKVVPYTFDIALEKVTQALQAEGFGVLTTIDVAATLKKKLNKDIPPYQILGACNPNYASKTLELEPSIGLLLPCNVVVRQSGEKVYVEIMDPIALMDLVAKKDVTEIAKEVHDKLTKVLQALD